MVDLPHDFGLQLMIIEHLYVLSAFHLIKLSHREIFSPDLTLTVDQKWADFLQVINSDLQSNLEVILAI